MTTEFWVQLAVTGGSIFLGGIGIAVRYGKKDADTESNIKSLSDKMDSIQSAVEEQKNDFNNMEKSVNKQTAVINTRLGYFEKKMDKNNCLVERMVVVEQSCKSAHHRIDENCAELRQR